MSYDNGMDKFEVNDVHDNDDLNYYNMNTLNNGTKHGGMMLNFYKFIIQYKYVNNLSCIQYKYRKCRKYRVGCKTCVKDSRYIFNK